MSDIRLKFSFPDHDKTDDMVAILGECSVRCLLRLWCWAAEHRPNGIFDGKTAVELERKAKWRGVDGDFIKALIRVGYIEQLPNGLLFCHDWADHQTWIIGAPERKSKATHAALTRWKKEVMETGNAPSNARDDATSIARSILPSNAPFLSLPFPSLPSPSIPKEPSTSPQKNPVTKKTVSDVEVGKTSTPDPVHMLQHTENSSSLKIIDGVIHVPKRIDKPDSEFNGFAVWIDANRDMKRKDPLPIGAALAASKRIAALYDSGKLLRKHFRRFLRDEDKFIAGRGYQLVDFEKNIEKYRNDPPKVQKPESQMTIDEIAATNPLCVINNPFEILWDETEVPLAQKNPRYIPGMFVYEGDYIRELIPGRFAPDDFPDELLKFLRDCGDWRHPNHEARLAWHRQQQELDLKSASKSTN